MSIPRYRREQKPRKPINQIGKGTRRWQPTRSASYARVSMRAKGRCELCDAKQDPLDPHHTFMRGHLGGIPKEVCERPEAILGVCRRCHDRCTFPHDADDLALADRAQWIAVERLTGIKAPDTYPAEDSPLITLRQWLRDQAA